MKKIIIEVELPYGHEISEIGTIGDKITDTSSAKWQILEEVIPRPKGHEVNYNDIQELVNVINNLLRYKNFDYINEFVFLTKLEKILYEEIKKYQKT